MLITQTDKSKKLISLQIISVSLMISDQKQVSTHLKASCLQLGWQNVAAVSLIQPMVTNKCPRSLQQNCSFTEHFADSTWRQTSHVTHTVTRSLLLLRPRHQSSLVTRVTRRVTLLVLTLTRWRCWLLTLTRLKLRVHSLSWVAESDPRVYQRKRNRLRYSAHERTPRISFTLLLSSALGGSTSHPA